MTTKTELAEAHRRIEELTQALETKHEHLLAQEDEAAQANARAQELEKALSKAEKQLQEAQEDRSRLERNLARTLGYIDRVLEAERPEITRHSVGEVSTEINNYQGPQLEEPPMRGDLPGLRRGW